MKTIYINLLLFSLIANSNIFGQPTLTATNSNPIIGEVINGQGINYTSPGSAGTGQVWDFSASISNGAQSFSFVDPSTTPNAASFLTSNICTFNPATSSYNYLTTSSTSILANGNFVSPSSLVPYSNPQKLLDYPFSMGSSFIDTYQGTYTSGPNTVIRKGIDTVTADGYGSLILPYGTLNNVLRVHTVDYYADTTTTGVAFASFKTVTYNWYLPNVHYQVMSLTSIYYNGNPVAQFGSYLDQATVGISEHNLLSPNFQIYPNPFSTSTTVMFSEEQKNTSIKITDILGKEIKLINFTGRQLSIDKGEMKAGIYFVETIDENRIRRSSRIIVQ